MASEYAFIDVNNVVVDVITGIDFDDTSNLADGFSSWEEFYGNHRGLTCKRTDIKTNLNKHEEGGTPLRGNYARIGGLYDPTNDVFYGQKPYPSWTLSSDWEWNPPVKNPLELDSDDSGFYDWDEENKQWVAR